MISGGSKEIYLKVKNPIDLANTSSVLLTLIGEKSMTDNFLSTDFGERPVIFRGGERRVSILKSLLFDIDILQMLENTASDQIHVWMTPLQVNNGGIAPSLESISIDDASQAFKLYLAGHSLYCRVPLELENYVIPKILNELQIGINCNKKTDRFSRGEIETFFTRKGHITDFHTDFQENFTIQLSGKKIWKFASSSAKYPLRGCTPHFKVTAAAKDIPEQQLKVMRLGDPFFTPTQYMEEFPHGSVDQADRNKNIHNRPNDSKNSTKSNNNSSQLPSLPSTSSNSSSTVIINAGDVLYHPAGIWHAVECIEDSISINISLISCSAAEIFCTNLQQLLCLRHPNYRKYLSGNRELASNTIKNIINDLPSLLQELVPGDFLPISCFQNNTCNDNINNNVSKSSTKRGGKDDDALLDQIGDVNNSQTISNSDMSEDERTQSEVEEKEEDEDIIVVGEFHLSSATTTTKNSEKSNVMPTCKSIFHPQSRFKINPLATVICIDDLWGHHPSSTSTSANCNIYVNSNHTTAATTATTTASTKKRNESINRSYSRRSKRSTTTSSTTSPPVNTKARQKVLMKLQDASSSTEKATVDVDVAVSKDYVVHSGYGNESVESLNRCQFRVPSYYSKWMKGYQVLQLAQVHRIKQGSSSHTTSIGGETKEVKEKVELDRRGGGKKRKSLPAEVSSSSSSLTSKNDNSTQLDRDQLSNEKYQRRSTVNKTRNYTNNKSNNNNNNTIDLTNILSNTMSRTRRNNRNVLSNTTTKNQYQATLAVTSISTLSSPLATTTTTITTTTTNSHIISNNEFTLIEFLYFCDEELCHDIDIDIDTDTDNNTNGSSIPDTAVVIKDTTPSNKKQRINKSPRRIDSTTKTTTDTKEEIINRKYQRVSELLEVLVFSGAITWLDG